jgi:NAD(P)-dependent dehydrogenase (short-subunit alcohol dehydrogenase family)
MDNKKMRTLEGKTAIVTGASRGIGRAIALHLAADGANVVLCARGSAKLAEAAAAIGASAAFLARDLREPSAPAELVRFALETFGRIDVVVNNAGATKRGEFLELTDEDWSDGYALKLHGAVRLARAAWPHLRQSPRFPDQHCRHWRPHARRRLRHRRFGQRRPPFFYKSSGRSRR